MRSAEHGDSTSTTAGIRSPTASIKAGTYIRRSSSPPKTVHSTGWSTAPRPAGFVRKRPQTRELQSSGSVLSANDPRVHFGLGPSNRIDRLVIRWPDGNTETIPGVAADRVIVVREGSRIVKGSAAPHH